MTVDPPLSPWARETFGARAELIREGVADSLRAAMDSAQDAQDHSQTDHRHPFGFTLMSRKFETLADTFRDWDGVEMVKPHGSPNEFVIIDGKLLFPFRYSRDLTLSVSNARIGDGRPSRLINDLFERYGPDRRFRQLTLVRDEHEEEQNPPTPNEVRLILIAYACNPEAGLLGAWWGEAELLASADGALHWHYHEELPLAHPSPVERNFAAVLPAKAVLPPRSA